MYYQSDNVSDDCAKKNSTSVQKRQKKSQQFPCQLNLPSLMDLQPGATAAICPRINATRPFHCCDHNAAALHLLNTGWAVSWIENHATWANMHRISWIVTKGQLHQPHSVHPTSVERTALGGTITPSNGHPWRWHTKKKCRESHGKAVFSTVFSLVSLRWCFSTWKSTHFHTVAMMSLFWVPHISCHDFPWCEKWEGLIHMINFYCLKGLNCCVVVAYLSTMWE